MSIKSSVDFQTQYQELYRNMRNYVWNVDALERLADLEIALYDAFVDRDSALTKMARLNFYIKPVYTEFEDDKLKESYDKLFECLSDSDDCYLNISSVSLTNAN